MTKVNIRVDMLKGFFDRARKAAQKADRGELFNTSTAYSFEDVQELPKAALEASKWLSSDTLDATH